MSIQTITKFFTEDGRAFYTEEDAEHHEAVRALAEKLEEPADDLCIRGSAYDIASWLLMNYNLTPKE
jgi:hypothetical protein